MNVPTPFADMLTPYRSAAVAQAVGVTGDTVRLWRRGKSVPSADKIPPLAEFLKCDADTIVAAIRAQVQPAEAVA